MADKSVPFNSERGGRQSNNRTESSGLVILGAQRRVKRLVPAITAGMRGTSRERRNGDGMRQDRARRFTAPHPAGPCRKHDSAIYNGGENKTSKQLVKFLPGVAHRHLRGTFRNVSSVSISFSAPRRTDSRHLRNLLRQSNTALFILAPPLPVMSLVRDGRWFLWFQSHQRHPNNTPATSLLWAARLKGKVARGRARGRIA